MIQRTNHHLPSRRRFLAVAGLSILASVLPSACRRKQSKEMAWLDLGRLLTGLDEEEALRVGQIHRDRTGLSRRQLIAALPNIEHVEWEEYGVRLVHEINSQSAIKDRVRQQYREGSHGEAAGWILSELELTILGLAEGVSG